MALSSDYIRDVRINEKLGTLLTLLMEQSWHPESMTVSRKRLELAAVKEYLDEHYTEKIALDDLSEHFFINKFYLSKIFRELIFILDSVPPYVPYFYIIKTTPVQPLSTAVAKALIPTILQYSLEV